METSTGCTSTVMGTARTPRGKKLPTVLFEGGETPVEDGLWQFADDAVNNGSISRYCFVDRPGLAWVSEKGLALE